MDIPLSTPLPTPTPQSAIVPSTAEKGKAVLDAKTYSLPRLISTGVACLLFGGAITAGVFFLMDVRTLRSKDTAISSALLNLPQCVDKDVSLDEDSLITSLITYNTATIGQLEKASRLLKNEEAKTVFSEEVARQKKELALYQKTYVGLHDKEYVPKEEELEVHTDSFSLSSVDEASVDNAYLGILFGTLSSRQREYYAFTLAHPNEDIRTNAKAFSEYKILTEKLIQELREGI